MLLRQLLHLAPAARYRTTRTYPPIPSITHRGAHVRPYWRLSDRMWNVSSFLSCYTVEPQLPTDACLLPGNQHSISPSTFSPEMHTWADTRRHTQACGHSCTQMHTPLPRLPATVLLEGTQIITDCCSCNPLLPSTLFCCWSSLFFCLFQHFSQSLKSCSFFPRFLLPEGTLSFFFFFSFTYSRRGNRSCNTLPTVKRKCVIHGQRRFYHVKWKICRREVTGMQVVLEWTQTDTHTHAHSHTVISVYESPRTLHKHAQTNIVR